MKLRWIVGGLAASALAALSALKLRDARHVARISQTLCDADTSDGVFDESMLEGLPGPARRYFRHAIAPGTRLATQLRWSYSGEMRPGKDLPWMALEAKQVIASERGFVWKVTARKGPLFVTGVDYFLDNTSRMRIELFGLVPVVNATGEDIARSALGRLLIERIALPATLLPGDAVRIEGIDDSRFVARVTLHGEEIPLTLTVDEDGRLLSVEMPRWGNITPDGSFRHIPYGVTFSGERTVDGYTIPDELAAGWWFGTPDFREDIRIQVEDIQFG